MITEARSRWLGIAWIAALAVLLSGCTIGSRPTISESSTHPPDPAPVAADPAPDGFDEATTVDRRGGRHQAVGVTVDVPAGTTTSTVSVSVGAAIGSVRTTYAQETYGQPVRIDHTEPLEQPVTVSWDVSTLTAAQRTGLLIVRWNSDLQMWEPLNVQPILADDSLRVETDQFSILDWVSSGAAALSQTVGEAMGKRAKAPTCPGNPDQKLGKLPVWVDGFVRPDEDQSGAPLRTCLEADKDEVVTVRIASNRPYGQLVRLTSGAKKYAWTWSGDQDYTIAGLVVGAVNQTLSSDNALLLGSVTTGAVGLGRPGSPGSHVISMSGHSSWQTILSDVLQFVLTNTAALDNLQGFDSEAMSAAVQAMYDCGGKALLKSRDPLDRQDVNRMLEVIQRCAANDSVMNAIENAMRRQIAQGGKSAERAVAANRMLKGALARLAVVKLVAELSSYTAELLSEAALGATTISLRGRGSPQLLGAWRPTCSDVASDSDALYRNLALQDEYADTSKELWQFKTWTANTKKAVKPLSACSPTYRSTLAQEVRGDWADAKAAGIVARAIEQITATLLDKYAPICSAMVGGTAEVSGAAPFQHPGWGTVDLVTCGATPDNTPAERQGLLIVDAAGTVRWKKIYRDAPPYYKLEPASPVTDATGNLFAIYNPGRYDGILILRPTQTGMTLIAGVYEDLLDHATPSGFYYAELLGPGKTGQYRIRQYTNDCTPDCAGGTVTHRDFRWDGDHYVAK